MTDILFNIDTWLQQLTALHPIGAYLVFFVIIFSESAFFPLAPVLPGDGFLFAVGVLASSGAVHLWAAIPILIVGGTLGNWIAYELGLKFGPTLFQRIKWLKSGHYQKAHQFYQKYGTRALFYSRFIPVVRALVPLVAGMAKMERKSFSKYNIFSVSFWVFLIVLSAYFLGHLPWIQKHFLWVVMGMACLSIVPATIVGLRHMVKK